MTRSRPFKRNCPEVHRFFKSQTVPRVPRAISASSLPSKSKELKLPLCSKAAHSLLTPGSKLFRFHRFDLMTGAWDDYKEQEPDSDVRPVYTHTQIYIVLTCPGH